jgi:hypothetical protein
LLDTVRNDKEENYNLLDKSMIRRLTIWHVKAFCKQCHEKKLNVSAFIKGLEAEFKLVSDYSTEIELEQELKFLEMARRFQQTFDPSSVPKVKKAKMIHTTEDGEDKPAEKEEDQD